MENKEAKIATKDEERAALKKIQKIVESLGRDSYLAMAFDGVWELASKNIENDWDCSVKIYIENFYKSQKKLGKITEKLVKSEHEVEQLHELIQKKTQRELTKNCESERALEKLAANEKLIDSLKTQVIRLKAKLYDCLSSED